MLTGDVTGDSGHSKVGSRAACFRLWEEPGTHRKLCALGNPVFLFFPQPERHLDREDKDGL